MRTYDLLRKSVRPKVSGRRALMFLGLPRNARQGHPCTPAPQGQSVFPLRSLPGLWGRRV